MAEHFLFTSLFVCAQGAWWWWWRSLYHCDATEASFQVQGKGSRPGRRRLGCISKQDVHPDICDRLGLLIHAPTPAQDSKTQQSMVISLLEQSLDITVSTHSHPHIENPTKWRLKPLSPVQKRHITARHQRWYSVDRLSVQHMGYTAQTAKTITHLSVCLPVCVSSSMSMVICTLSLHECRFLISPKGGKPKHSSDAPDTSRGQSLNLYLSIPPSLLISPSFNLSIFLSLSLPLYFCLSIFLYPSVSLSLLYCVV